MIFNIKGAYGETNFGDDLLMHVFENYFIEEFPNSILNFEGDPAKYVLKILNKGTYNRTSQCDWLIYGGGTQFFAFRENSELSILEKLKIGLKTPSLVYNKFFKAKRANLNIENKIAFLGFGLGPFYGNQTAIKNAKDTIELANYVGVRDEVSHNYCNDWGIPSILGADVVFSSYFKHEIEKKNTEEKKNKKIGIIVRDWDYEDSGKAYISELLKFVKSKESEDYKIIIFAPKKDKNWIKEISEDKLVVWDPSKFSINEFLEILNEYDAFISARYHGAIIAALLGKPVICVEIEPKLKILVDQIKEFKLWEKPFKIEALRELIKDIDYNVDYSISLESRKNLANKMLKNFKEYVNG